MTVRIHAGDCREILPTLPECSVDAVVTDPPYGLGFMGKDWDHSVPGVPFWEAVLRVAKPGAHLLAFGGTRTHHLLMVAIEDAGWELRDTIGWLFGSGFPKSLDVSKAIDKAAGAERFRVLVPTKPGNKPEQAGDIALGATGMTDVSEPITDAARQWQGWGTALKPAWEPIILARKPLSGTVASNVLQHGTGALNIEGCRIGTDDTRAVASKTALGVMNDDAWQAQEVMAGSASGRWPANLIHDGSDEALAVFPEAPGQIADLSSSGSRTTQQVYGDMKRGNGRDGEPSAERRYTEDGGTNFAATPDARRGDTGSAARFFYCAKADRADRNDGCDGLDGLVTDDGRKVPADNAYQRGKTLRQNHHPTVKPTDLMRYLCRLVTPPGGTILDPFMGSGSTGRGAVIGQFGFIGIELDPRYADIAEARIRAIAPLFVRVERDEAARAKC